MFNKFILFVMFCFIVVCLFTMRDITLYSILMDANIDCVFSDNMNCIECDLDISTLCSVLSLDNIHYCYVGSSLVCEGYTAKLHDYKVVNGKKVNIQMSYFDEKLVVGYPLIYNSF